MNCNFNANKTLIIILLIFLAFIFLLFIVLKNTAQMAKKKK